MTTERAADELMVTPEHVARMIRSGKLKAEKVSRGEGSNGGQAWKVDGKSVRSLAAKRRKAGLQ